MVDFDPNSRYRARQQQLMAVISIWGPEFLSEVDTAAVDERNADLVSQARLLLSRLKEDPFDDSAFAAHRDIEMRIAETEAFLEYFKSVETSEGRAVVEKARDIHGILVSLKGLIEIAPNATPPRTGLRWKPDLENRDKKYHTSIGTPLMFAVMAGILAARWFGYWKVSWLIIIPIAYLAGAVAAAILSLIINMVRGS